MAAHTRSVWYWALSSTGEVWCRGIKLVCIACRAYKWIVKGGEDVRTDERMEMILDVCNGLLTRHPGAASHRLKVRPHLSMVAAWETMETVPMPMPAVRENMKVVQTQSMHDVACSEGRASLHECLHKS